jgi:hypothetical protein
MRFSKNLLTIGLLVLMPISTKVIGKTPADGGANHQVSNTNFGVSGGNVNDAGRSFCCSGTLGALVQDSSGVNYILSNNHVVGRSGQAVAGEDISQPGLIDNGCRIPPIVADFTVAPQLGPSNVDAAIAQLRAGAMNTTGAIEDIGTISSMVKTPAVGLLVAKSGRTTGFTTGTIGSVDATVRVQYQQGCGKGKKFSISFTNQVVINGSNFSAGGDSGSLIVTNDLNHQPVALLFAGSSTTTIGNPAGEVLIKIGAALGRSVNFVGDNKGTSSADPALSITPIENNNLRSDDVSRSIKVKRKYEQALMSQPEVLAVGVGGSETNSAEATIVVYADRTAGRRPALPAQLDNVRVRVIPTDPIIAY